MIIHSKLIIHLLFPISHCFPSLKHQLFGWLTQALIESSSELKASTAAPEFTVFASSFTTNKFHCLVNWHFSKQENMPIAINPVTQAWVKSHVKFRLPNDTGNYKGKQTDLRENWLWLLQRYACACWKHGMELPSKTRRQSARTHVSHLLMPFPQFEAAQCLHWSLLAIKPNKTVWHQM